MPTARFGQWLYLLDDGGLVYSESQNRFVGLDMAGVLAYRAFDKGSNPDDLHGFGRAISDTKKLNMQIIFGLSRGQFPDTKADDRLKIAQLDLKQKGVFTVHHLPILFAATDGIDTELCRDCFKSCPSAMESARFHLQILNIESCLAICVNGQEMLRVPNSEQVGLGLLHVVRSLLYNEVDYDVAFHAAMIGDGRYALMLCAPRESGKSTLAAYLTGHNYSFITDEPALLRLDTTCIAPVEMPISLKEGSWVSLKDEWPQLAVAPIHRRSDGRRLKFLHPPKDSVASASQRLTHILFPKYSPSSPPQIKAVSTMQKFALLNEGGMLFNRQFSKNKFEQFLELICATPAFSITYSSFQEAEQLVHNVLSRRSVTESVNEPAGC